MHYIMKGNSWNFEKRGSKICPTHEGKWKTFEKWKVFWFSKNGQKKCPKWESQKSPYWPIFSVFDLHLYGLKRDYKKKICDWKIFIFFAEKYLGRFSCFNIWNKLKQNSRQKSPKISIVIYVIILRVKLRIIINTCKP